MPAFRPPFQEQKPQPFSRSASHGAKRPGPRKPRTLRKNMLRNNDTVRKQLAGILSEEQLAAFEALQAKDKKKMFKR